MFRGRYGTENDAVEASHYGVGGRGLKAPDNFAGPVLHSDHREMHQRGQAKVLFELLSPADLIAAVQLLVDHRYYQVWKDG